MPMIKNHYSHYVFLNCDGTDCHKKIEGSDPRTIEFVAKNSRWGFVGDKRYCPKCSPHYYRPPQKRKTAKKKKK